MGEVEGLILLLRTACEDQSINAILQKLLSMPNDRRQTLVHNWVSDLIIKKAPNDFIQAIACLSDDAIAEKAYETIYNCPR